MRELKDTGGNKMITDDEIKIIEYFRKDPQKVIEVFNFILEERKASSKQAPALPEKKNATI